MIIKILKWVMMLFISLMVIAIVFSKFLNFSISGDKKIAIDFIEKNSKNIVSMQFEKIKPLMTSSYINEFNSNENEVDIRKYFSLGKIKSYDNPVYYGSDTTVGEHSKNQRIFYFLIRVHFDSGDAEIKASLLKSSDSFLIEKLKISFD